MIWNAWSLTLCFSVEILYNNLMVQFKKALRYLDKKFFGSYFVELRGYSLLLKQRQEFDSSFHRSIRINYDYRHNDLAALCDKYGTDKGSNREYNPSDEWPSHTYTDYYHEVFGKNRFEYKNIFECGIGTNNSDVKGYFKLQGTPGASLRVWRDFFPNAMIFGADIDPRVLVHENRITSQVMDQLDPYSILEYFKSMGFPSFDLMIDDGLHEFYAGKILYENAIQYLKPGGVYIIEDVVLDDLLSYRSFFSNSKHLVQYVSMQRTKIGLKSIAHNSLVVIEKRD
jgi:hypothetical protein